MVNFLSIKQLLDASIGQLTASPSARLDAEVLLAHVLEQPRSFLHARPEEELSATQHRQFAALLQRRVQGEPIAYLIGRQEFWSLPLQVNAHTLIPRPETELLVATTLELALRLQHKPVTAIDLGTGSGCIALALAHECPEWRITAVDRSHQALQIAQANARELRIDNVEWHVSDWFKNVKTESFDLIISNPPYIETNDPHLQRGDVRFEPQQALIGGDNGLEAITAIATQARNRMHAGSYLLLEIGHDQADKVKPLLSALGYSDIEFRKDLSGIDRVCISCHK
ncbi:MAG TPA: peptide chain release factor N(5)-glutamine methyltransferase [Gammaproteobacteria bacterium]